MNLKNAIFIGVVVLSLSSCTSDIDEFKNNYTLEITNDKSDWNEDDTVQISLIDDGSIGVDSVVWTQNARRLDDVEGITLSRKLKNQPYGDLTYKVKVYHNGMVTTAATSINLKNPVAPKILNYTIVNTYPHSNVYTQGLEFHEGKLYESAGQYGESSIRITEAETGIVLKEKELPDTVFAEGLTILNNNIYQLTWRGRFGYIYDLDLNQTGQFKYGSSSKEGWGLCNDGEFLYKSDGTDKIWKLDPNTFEELEYIQIVSKGKSLTQINELEWVNGKIYANIYQENAIMIVDPATGALEAAIDLKDLKNQIPNWDKEDNVLNGIAYDKVSNRLFVTGKRWPKMFEIEVTQ
ncbi:glutaminyl-peptide cyclotransferase [Nonlabens marinus]|uniref:Glutamine cyclotransferase n=1 Tax=Nonlabens marinus S1-08 TaxID=1454201 RepID=W8VW24_9FLAO|nr:glutaminyl-peptide cyclotransferase [Nonlabens marinus]BAO55958.1 glutamine cyclotransferase [Nonlabens marinus S1-08]